MGKTSKPNKILSNLQNSYLRNSWRLEHQVCIFYTFNLCRVFQLTSLTLLNQQLENLNPRELYKQKNT